ncbi:VPLPA-CTERM sorting domain-containing protein [Aliishimia ponticola]|uniref:VPLPA-CTERM sorting domain-containing protein n=2 Tax=Aliishimia ponticola TaxID=2499833 RepID=A0A4S4ND02_9RHOB|nr:VPLPA-CTERM sorting domain-containing protein [Aliishimia ponticola]
MFALAGVGYGNGSLKISYDPGLIAPVPVPASFPLLIGGVAGLFVMKRRAKG